MIARATVLATALLTAPLAAQAPIASAPVPYSIPQTAVFPVTSPGGETYMVSVAWPEETPPSAGWPVLYVLDGEDNFAIAALTARRLARAGERSGTERGVVVGIDAGPLARRVRDYTPATPGWAIPAGAPASGMATGGADAFVALIEQRVMPEIGRRWRIDASRETLMGHSFGGLLALHVALTRPDTFDRVVAVSPSLWFGDGLVAREAAEARTAPHMLIAEGDGPEAGPLATKGGSRALVDSVSSRRGAGAARFLPLPGQTHGSTMLAAMVPAISFSFGRDGR